MSKTFLKYFISMQLKIMFFVACFVIGFIFIFTFADMMRKIPYDAISPLSLCIYLSALRVPYTYCELVCYTYLIAATFSLWNLSQSHEITVLKSIGTSTHQILFPYFTLSFFIGISFIFIIHPLCVKVERFADYQEKIYLSKSSMSSKNVWMQNTEKTIFIGKLSDSHMNCLSIINNKKNETLYADSVNIQNNDWQLLNGYILKNNKIETFKKKTIKELINKKTIDLYSIVPQRSSVYSLLKCLYAKESYATDIGRYILNLNKIISNGVVFFLFSMIAAIVCLPLNRYKTKTFVSGSVIGSAILLHLFNGICESMGNNGSLSPIICIWIPTIAAISLSLALLIWKEE